MKKWLNTLFWDQENTYKRLAPENQAEVNEYNEKMISVIIFIGGLLMLPSLFAVPFSDTKIAAVPLYLTGIVASFGLFILFRFCIIKKYTKIGIYIYFSGVFLFAIYLSVIHTPNMRATILLGIFSIIPLCIIDRPAHMNAFMAVWFVIHTVLAFQLKPQYALDDAINSLSFAILGSYLGNIMTRVRLESYEAHRQLTIEKETDVLTGLLNRRKLLETLVALETTNIEKPSGIIMIDTDHFKDFNDKYGHMAGDGRLSKLGDMLLNFTQKFRINFYRYGGDEFVGVAYGYDQRELMSLAESLRLAVQDKIMYEQYMTVSIGVAYSGDQEVSSYKNIIEKADKALYVAKHLGRNRVHIDQN